MQNVLILTNNLGGLFSFRKEVVEAIIENGYKVVISCPHSKEKKTDLFKIIGCEIVYTSLDRRGTNPFHDIVLVKKYLQLMRIVKPLAVLTYTIKPNIYGGVAARWLGIPQLANITGLGDAIENTGLLQKITICMCRFGLKKTRKVFYQNIAIQQFCDNKHIGNNGCLIPGSGVNLEWHSFQDYPLENEIIKFIFVGRVMRDKGIEEFVEMSKTIKSKYPYVQFHIIGRCEEQYADMLNQLQNKGVLIWHGPVSDVRPYFKESWCTIHPSYHEGMANVLLESCAAGRPVITSNINGCKEAVDEGVNGFLFKVKDASDLIKKVEQFINLPYEQKKLMGAAARKKMERDFDRQFVVNAYLKEIKAIE